MLCLWIFQRHSTLWTFIIKAASTWHQRPTTIMGKDFLTNRHQHVVLGGRYPSWKSLLCEVHVPQRTVLRPILFLIYINDITWKIESQCKLFADEMKVYKVLRNVHKDTQILQNDLNTLEQWSSEWQLSFNTTKCEVHTKNIRNKRPWCLCI